MTDPTIVARVLPYCRSLHREAEELLTAHRDLDDDRRQALVGWQGPLSDTMRTTRRPEEVADVDIAVAAMRSEADLWADTWAALVDRINWKVYDETVERVVEHAASIEGEALYPNPASAVPLPERAQVPAGPHYFTPPSFVSYLQVDEWRYRAHYSTNPASVYW